MSGPEYILTPEGRLFLQPVRVELEPTQQMMDTIASGIVRKASRVTTIEGIGPVGIALDSQGGCYVSAIMNSILLIAPLAKDENTGNFYPNFNDREANSPCATIEWTPPSSMDIVYMARFDANKRYQSSWFFAFDPDKRTWRLPLPNISEDCAVCIGNNPIRGETFSGAYKTAYERFRGSRWNSDWMHNPEHVRKFWQFSPVSDGFEWVVPDDHWTNYSSKVVNTVLENAAV